MREELSKIDRKSFVLITALVGVLLVAVSLTYFVVPSFKEFREYSDSYQVLNAAISDGEQLEVKLKDIELEVAKNRKTLEGDASNLPFKQFESHVIGQLQALAWKNELVLVGVRPGLGESIDQFQEVTFNVSLLGEYFNIYRMLNSFEEKLGFVVIKKLKVFPGGLREQKNFLNVEMIVASYRGGS